VFCGLCVEACPEDAIRMDTEEISIVGRRREDFIVGMDFLLAGQGNDWRRLRGPEEPEPEQALSCWEAVLARACNAL
jgi:NADH-quinone oxidoreductase subunit I